MTFINKKLTDLKKTTKLRMSAKLHLQIKMQLQQVGRRMDEVHARGLSCFVHVRPRLRDGPGRAEGRNQHLIRGLLATQQLPLDNDG